MAHDDQYPARPNLLRHHTLCKYRTWRSDGVGTGAGAMPVPVVQSCVSTGLGGGCDSRNRDNRTRRSQSYFHREQG
eukprot:3033597-Rhodomonas_salina.2